MLTGPPRGGPFFMQKISPPPKNTPKLGKKPLPQPPPQAGEGTQPSFFDSARVTLMADNLRQRRLFQRLSILSLLLGIVVIGLG
jgi:hypothetical protein